MGNSLIEPEEERPEPVAKEQSEITVLSQKTASLWSLSKKIAKRVSKARVPDSAKKATKGFWHEMWTGQQNRKKRR